MPNIAFACKSDFLIHFTHLHEIPYCVGLKDHSHIIEKEATWYCDDNKMTNLHLAWNCFFSNNTLWIWGRAGSDKNAYFPGYERCVTPEIEGDKQKNKLKEHISQTQSVKVQAEQVKDDKIISEILIIMMVTRSKIGYEYVQLEKLNISCETCCDVSSWSLLVIAQYHSDWITVYTIWVDVLEGFSHPYERCLDRSQIIMM